MEHKDNVQSKRYTQALKNNSIDLTYTNQEHMNMQMIEYGNMQHVEYYLTSDENTVASQTPNTTTNQQSSFEDQYNGNRSAKRTSQPIESKSNQKVVPAKSQLFPTKQSCSGTSIGIEDK